VYYVPVFSVGIPFSVCRCIYRVAHITYQDGFGDVEMMIANGIEADTEAVSYEKGQ
jgi:hypothetical protein